MSKLPEFLGEYFWDVNFEDLDTEEHKFLITKRVLDRGNTIAIRWLVSTYGVGEIKSVVMSSRDLSPQTARLWTNLLGLPEGRVPCLNKPYSPIPFGLSS